MNMIIPDAVQNVGISFPLVVTNPFTEVQFECKNLDDFKSNFVDDLNHIIKTESFIHPDLINFDCEDCLAFPYVDKHNLKNVVGYAINGEAKEWDYSQTPAKVINSQKVSFAMGAKGVLANNTDINHINLVVATNDIHSFVKLAKTGITIIYDQDIDLAFEIINEGFRDEIFRVMLGEKEPKNNKDLFIPVDENFKKLNPLQFKKELHEKVNDLKKCFDIGSESKRTKSKTSLQIVSMSDVQAQAINWLWAGWLPLGKLTILAGAGGCGKTTLLLSLISSVTTGGKFPDGSNCNGVGSVIIFSTEDDPADTLKPRLMAAGANLNKVYFVQGRINEKGEKEAFDPSQDMDLLLDYAKQVSDLKLLMIDPIVSAVGGDMHRANDVRRSLQTIVDFAQHISCAVVGITHFAKGTSGTSPSERIIGSQAFTALARMVWTAARREDENDCILVRAKSNISELDGGVRYEIEQCTVADNIDATKTVWLGLIEGSARELLNDVEATSATSSVLDEAREFLIDILSPVDSLPTKEVEQLTKNAGLSWASIRRASAELKIKKSKIGADWVWKLPLGFSDTPKVLQEDKQTY